MYELKGVDENGNNWKFSMVCSNPKYTNRYELIVSFNDAEFPISKYSTHQQAAETWAFLEKFCSKGTPFPKMDRIKRNKKEDKSNG